MQVTQEMELILDKSEGDFPLFQSEWLEKWVTAIVVWAKKGENGYFYCTWRCIIIEDPTNTISVNTQ